jgi:omega-6 fatty acid desaturase (delta-12 desaturase)
LIGFLVPILISHALGAYLFYAQHNFPSVTFKKKEEWSYTEAALFSSSYMKLNKFMQWCTGNIGFHHIHHLSPRIPNYRLEKCHYENEVFRKIEPLTIRSSLKSAHIRLFDEDRGKMIGYHKPDEAPAVEALHPQIEPATSGGD